MKRKREVPNAAGSDVVPQWVRLEQRGLSLLIPLLNGKEGRRERGTRETRLKAHEE